MISYIYFGLNQYSDYISLAVWCKYMTIGNLLSNPKYAHKWILEKLICHYCDIGREQMWIDIDKDVPDGTIDNILLWYKKYTEDKMPLEYILWKVTFLWYNFVVSKDTLIPRPETEYMIQAINEYVTDLSDLVLLDVGTWCGVLGLSVLLHNPWVFATALLSDYSDDALSVAKQNYALFEDSIQANQKATAMHFLHVSLVEYLHDYRASLTGKSAVLVANLPYIPDETFDTSADDTVKKWEPRMAFVGGDDGLDLYRIMFDQLLQFQSTEEKLEKVVLFLEMMTWQVEILREAYGDKMIFEEVKTFHFNIRIVKAIIKE